MSETRNDAAAREAFTVEVHDGIAVLTFDLPGEPVNTLSGETGEAFTQHLEKLEADPAVKGIVLISGKRDSFVAGAKIEMLQGIKTADEATQLARRAQAGFDRLERSPKPVVAAIHGACLGGGLEWAMACRYRIATDHPKTTLGLPEVQLGLLPGAGGTQRLPKLVGMRQALDLILAGKTLKASKAKKAGVVDEVVPAPILLEVAKRRARELADGTLMVDRGHKPEAPKKGLAGLLQGLSEAALEDNPVGRKVLFDQARKKLLEKTGGKYPAPERALTAIKAGADKGMKEGLEVEATLFGELVMSDVSHRLIEIFFATNALKKENGTSDAKVAARPVKKVGVLGGGLMGAGIAYVTAAQMGVDVRVKDKDDAGMARAMKQVRDTLDERVQRRSLTRREADAVMARVTTSTDYSGFRTADLVIEAVFEDLALKHKVLKDTEAVTHEECIFASNTSALPITDIAAASSRPHTVIGMHYFSPVNKMPLLEIITHKGTASWVTATCVEVGRKQGKTVIVVNDGVGFYTTRILGLFMNEAAHLLEEGADITDVDKALVEFGFPVGPFVLLDEVGIDVGVKVAKTLHEAFGSRAEASAAIPKLLADQRLGRKNKRGFYLYEGKTKEVDTSVYALLSHGMDRKRMDRQEIAERCVLQMVNEAIRCLGEGILRSPRDGDIGAIFGLGFPAFLGGPFRYVDTQGPEKILAKLEGWHQKLGARFEPAPLLREYVAAKRRFYE
jgi:3-hydroxyacyl-CoA dehydrogenase/enoyl-CoA hydratase/3-hydroxybutyryl-CoA epimerase